MDMPAMEKKRIILMSDDGARLEIPIKSALQCDKLRELATRVVSCCNLFVPVRARRQLVEKVLMYLEKHAAAGDGVDGGVEEFDATFVKDLSVQDLFDLLGAATDLEAMELGSFVLKEILKLLDEKTVMDFSKRYGISENDVKEALEQVAKAIN